MPEKKPKYIVVYRCQTCGLESGYTELDKPLCRYCDKETTLTIVSKDKLTIESISKRLKTVTDNLMMNLQKGYDSMPEELKENATQDFDPEKELLKIMAKAKSLREKTQNLKLKNKKDKKTSSNLGFNQLQILPAELLAPFSKKADKGLPKSFQNLHDSELSKKTFSFYTSVSAVFSSKIEGEDIELDSYIKHKRYGIKFLPDHTQKIDDLYNAYQYAKKKKLTEKNITEAHKLLTKHILPLKNRGKIRSTNMFVTTPKGKIEYVAAVPSKVKSELTKFHADLNLLLKAKLSFNEVFFFASMIHLVFVKIHPFDDGNGRTARLLEKWFIAQKLGSKAWFIESEKYYYDHHATYYKNIRALGLEYPELNYSKALPFLLMLPKSLKS